MLYKKIRDMFLFAHYYRVHHIRGGGAHKMNISVLPASMILCSVVLLCPNFQNADSQVHNLSLTEYGRQFLAEHSTEDMKKTIMFIQSPVRYFDCVKGIDSFCKYIDVYGRFFNETSGSSRDFYDIFLKRNFSTISRENVPILTFLLLSCQGNALFSELLAEAYTVLFESDPALFVIDLKGRKNWRIVLDSLKPGSWPALQSGLTKLGNSRFEREIKAYIFATRPKRKDN